MGPFSTLGEASFQAKQMSAKDTTEIVYLVQNMTKDVYFADCDDAPLSENETLIEKYKDGRVYKP